MQPEKFGIDNIKKAIGVGMDLAKGFHDALSDDGKIGFFETLGIGTKVAFPIADVVRNRKQFLDEFRDLSQEEKMQIEQWVKTTYQIPNDRVQSTVEDALNLFLEIISFSLKMAEIWKKKK